MENLCAYWRFNEVQTGRVLDASGRNNFASLGEKTDVSVKPLHANNPVSDEDEWGENVQMGHSVIGEIYCDEIRTESSSGTSLTVELYVRRMSTGPTSACKILSINDSLNLSVNRQAEVVLATNGRSESTSKRLVNNEWTHLAIVTDSSGMRLYINGECSLSLEVIDPIITHPWSVRIGSKLLEMTEVRIWDCVRSEDQILQYMSICLPRAAPVSRWRGMRINIKPDASSRSWTKPIPESIAVPPTKSRRVSDEPAMTEIEVSNKEKAVVGESPPLAEPEKIEVAQDNELPQSPKPIREEATVEQSLQQPLAVPKTEERVTVVNPTPILVPSALADALTFFDKTLEAAIVNRDLVFNRAQLEGIVSAISSYMRSEYRIGPYLAPMPPESLLSRLKIAATYLGLLSVLLNANNSWVSNVALRLPLLTEHIPILLLRCIEEAKVRSDPVSQSMLAKALIRDYGSFLSADQVESYGRLIGFHSSGDLRTQLLCPFCHTKLRDPIQSSCLDGCGTRYSVCYVTGSIAPLEDCARCRLCSTVISVKQFSIGAKRGSVPNMVKMTLPPACVVCGCFGSLVALA